MHGMTRIPFRLFSFATILPFSLPPPPTTTTPSTSQSRLSLHAWALELYIYRGDMFFWGERGKYKLGKPFLSCLGRKGGEEAFDLGWT